LAHGSDVPDEELAGIQAEKAAVDEVLAEQGAGQ
jgi:hypothetical protein